MSDALKTTEILAKSRHGKKMKCQNCQRPLFWQRHLTSGHELKQFSPPFSEEQVFRLICTRKKREKP